MKLIKFLPAIKIAAFCFFAAAALPALAQVKISTNIPGPAPAGNPCGFVVNFYIFSLWISGVLAFGAIVYGGVKYTLAAGNPSAQNEGKEWIKGALLGLLLLVGAYIVLNTINPDLVKLGGNCLPTLEAGSAPPPAATNTTTTASCSNPSSLCGDSSALAKCYNERFPRGDATDLTSLKSCIEQGASLAGKSVGSIFTYDQTYDLCNYTRGNVICTIKCSHSINSCHYGGASNNQGAEAVDYGNEKEGAFLISQAMTCGAASARCENDLGKTVDCSAFDATHVHVSAKGCL